METNKINQLIMMMKDNLPDDKLMLLKNSLEDADDSVFDAVMLAPMKKPIMTLLLSIFLGAFGVDRFYIGDVGMGVAKLLLGWATCGIWPLIDIFFSYRKAKEINFNKVMMMI